jgi:hypothetical protein
MAENKPSKTSVAKAKKRRRMLSEGVIIALIGLTGTIIAAILSSPLLEKQASPVSTLQPVFPSQTSELSLTLQNVFTPTVTPALTQVTTTESNSTYLDILVFLTILQLLVFSCLIPAMYMIIILFAVIVIRRAPTVELRIRSLVAVLGAILFALAFVIVDMTATGLARQWPIDPTNIFVVIPVGIVSAIVGFFVLFATDIFLRRGAAAFVVFFLVWISLVSAYFLIRAAELRGIISLSVVAFLFGNIVYILANFGFVKRFFQLTNSAEDNADL